MKRSQKSRAIPEVADRKSDNKHSKSYSDAISVKDAHTVYSKKTQKGDVYQTVSKQKTTSITSGRTAYKVVSVPSLSSSPQQVTKNGKNVIKIKFWYNFKGLHVGYMTHQLTVAYLYAFLNRFWNKIEILPLDITIVEIMWTV